MLRYRFSLRSLLLTTLVIASFFGLAGMVLRSWMKRSGIGHLGYEDWPRALTRLIDDQSELQQHVRVFGIGGFFEDESVWYIKEDSPILDRLYAENTLEPATLSHPKIERLKSSIPWTWNAPNLSDCTLRATPGYGQQHIEGVDLFLIAHDSRGQGTLVLHHWIF